MKRMCSATLPPLLHYGGFATTLGTVEITICVLIALRPFSARASGIGDYAAVGYCKARSLRGPNTELIFFQAKSAICAYSISTYSYQ